MNAAGASWVQQPVAVVDDREIDRETLGYLLHTAGLEPIYFTGHYESVSALTSEIEATTKSAVCDHRLRPYGLGPFDGAEVVAALYDRKFPAVLVTQFPDDADLSIRAWRDRVPVLLNRKDATAAAIKSGIGKAIREVAGEMSPDREAWRTLIRIEDVGDDGGELAVRAVVPGWDPDQIVTFPLSLVPPSLRSSVIPDSYLVARVNIGATRREDVYLADFEAPPTGDLGDF